MVSMKLINSLSSLFLRRNKPKKFEDVKTYSDLLLQLWSDDESFIITKGQLIAVVNILHEYGKQEANHER
jgi:hypothetical protein